MNKKNLLFAVGIMALLYSAVNFSNPLQQPLNKGLNKIKLTYQDILSTIRFNLDIYFFQADEIKRLKSEVKYLKKVKVELINYKENLKDLKDLCQYDYKNIDKKTLQTVKVISYQRFGDTYRLWIDVKDYNSSKVYGLIYHDMVAGIVVNKNSMPLALLNKDIKSSYAVFVGKDNAPAIVHGNNDRFLIATYIPMWYNIKTGDEVVTSGLDNVFFRGLRVGRVVSVSSSQGYKSAKIVPYFDRDDVDYFYMIKR